MALLAPNSLHMRFDDASLAWTLLGKGLDLYQNGVFITGEAGRFVYVNDAAVSALGYSREALLTMGPGH